MPPPDNTLFEACFRIQREAIEATRRTCRCCRGDGLTRGCCRCEACDGTGVEERHIPLVVENVLGAQKWVGRARWHYGSFYLWGDVPALMPMVRKHVKVATMGAGWYPPDHPKHVRGLAFNGHAERALKTAGHVNQRDGYNHTRHLTNQAESDAVKKVDNGYAGISGWGNGHTGSKSTARKAASAHIAKIPLSLARHIGRAWFPEAHQVERRR